MKADKDFILKQLKGGNFTLENFAGMIANAYNAEPGNVKQVAADGVCIGHEGECGVYVTPYPDCGWVGC